MRFQRPGNGVTVHPSTHRDRKIAELEPWYAIGSSRSLVVPRSLFRRVSENPKPSFVINLLSVAIKPGETQFTLAKSTHSTARHLAI